MKELIFPSCPKCRMLRIAMCVAVMLVIGTYAAILIGMNKPEPEKAAE